MKIYINRFRRVDHTGCVFVTILRHIFKMDDIHLPLLSALQISSCPVLQAFCKDQSRSQELPSMKHE